MLPPARLPVSTPFWTMNVESFVASTPLPSAGFPRSMRIVPGKVRLSYQVVTVALPAESQAVVFCTKVMVRYHLPA